MPREAELLAVSEFRPLLDEGARRAAMLSARYGALDGLPLLRAMLKHEFPERMAIVSSFGAESAVLLALAAEIDPATPVIFLDTGKLFGETRKYRDTLVARLGLTGVRTVHPDPLAEAARDPEGALWRDNPNACCDFRKVEPLARAMAPYDAWVTGRKRFQAATRAALPTIETDDDGRIKINPLANWTAREIADEFIRRDLPRHPLVADGFLSIGCMPCTDRVPAGADARSGRWAGLDKSECGIHVSRIPANRNAGGASSS
jgi:phosphoadenosine phosphosulfate reductase